MLGIKIRSLNLNRSETVAWILKKSPGGRTMEETNWERKHWILGAFKFKCKAKNLKTNWSEYVQVHEIRG